MYHIVSLGAWYFVCILLRFIRHVLSYFFYTNNPPDLSLETVFLHSDKNMKPAMECSAASRKEGNTERTALNKNTVEKSTTSN